MRNFLRRVAAGPNQMVAGRGRPRAAAQGDRAPTAYVNRNAVNRGSQRGGRLGVAI